MVTEYSGSATARPDVPPYCGILGTMKRFIIALMLSIPSLAWGAPAIVFQAETHDFGVVRQGEQLQFTFEFSNDGTDELTVSQITTFT